MKKTHLFGLILLLFVAAIAISSCGGTKKCNGKKGIKTPMGVM